MAWWGDAPDLKRLCEYANYADCPRSPGRTIPVGSLRPNPWGLYDVLGNVFEMTGSAYDKNYGGAEKRQAVPDDKALYAVRGGSWHPQIDTLRLAWRGRTDKASKRVKWQMGFRLARD
jgi:formylglycine-generating enzyme required for sulfatase activity